MRLHWATYYTIIIIRICKQPLHDISPPRGAPLAASDPLLAYVRLKIFVIGWQRSSSPEAFNSAARSCATRSAAPRCCDDSCKRNCAKRKINIRNKLKCSYLSSERNVYHCAASVPCEHSVWTERTLKLPDRQQGYSRCRRKRPTPCAQHISATTLWTQSF